MINGKKLMEMDVGISTKEILLAFILCAVASARGGELNLLNFEPEKIEYYGRPVSYPPQIIKLESNGFLYQKSKNILLKKDWRVWGLAGSKVPNIKVLGMNDAFSMNITPSGARIFFTDESGKTKERIIKLDSSVYEEIQHAIQGDHVNAGKGKKPANDSVGLLESEKEFDVVSEALDVIVDQIILGRESIAPDHVMTDEGKREFSKSIVDQVLNNPDVSHAIKEEILKNKEVYKDKVDRTVRVIEGMSKGKHDLHMSIVESKETNQLEQIVKDEGDPLIRQVIGGLILVTIVGGSIFCVKRLREKG